MVCVAYSSSDAASANIAREFAGLAGFDTEAPAGVVQYGEQDGIKMVKILGSLLDNAEVDKLAGGEEIVFLSKHSSAKGIPSLTTHAEGNWTGDASFGGKPRTLSISSPIMMLSALSAMYAMGEGMPVTYEATHHGPLTETPSIFVELGGSDGTVRDTMLAARLARALYSSITGDPTHFDEVAVGIGGTHYPSKFTKLALGGRYAFSHILPRYHLHSIDMLGQAVRRSAPVADKAVIEWKGIKSEDRNAIVKTLDELGIDHVRV